MLGTASIAYCSPQTAGDEKGRPLVRFVAHVPASVGGVGGHRYVSFAKRSIAPVVTDAHVAAGAAVAPGVYSLDCSPAALAPRDSAPACHQSPSGPLPRLIVGNRPLLPVVPLSRSSTPLCEGDEERRTERFLPGLVGNHVFVPAWPLNRTSRQRESLARRAGPRAFRTRSSRPFSWPARP